MFGQPAQQQQQQSTGLFGSTTNQQSSTTGGGLFGSAAPAQQPAGGMFGSTTQQQPQQGGGLFGSTNQQQGGGMFGSTNKNQQGSLFGNNQPQQQPSLFGSTNQNGASQQPQQQPQQQSSLWQSTIGGGTRELDIEGRMMKVKNSWDPASAEYKFKVSLQSTVSRLITRRSCTMSWTRGLRISMDDRDSTISYGRWLLGRTPILPRTSTISRLCWCLTTRRIPVAVNGPQDLQKRRQKQIEMAAMQQHISKVRTRTL